MSLTSLSMTHLLTLLRFRIDRNRVLDVPEIWVTVGNGPEQI